MDPELEVIVPGTGIEPDLDFDAFEVTDDSEVNVDYAAMIAAKDAELEALRQKANLSDGMSQGFQTLAKQLQSQNAPDYSNLPGLPGMPTPKVNQYMLPDKESFEKDFFTNPYDSFQKMLAPVVGHQQEAMNTQMAELKRMISQNQAYMSEDNKEILSKYGDEVKVYASRLQGNDPWGDAIKSVRNNHFNDILGDKIKTTEQAAYDRAKAEFEAASKALGKGPASPVGMSNLGTMTNPVPSRVKVTKAEMDKVKQMTAMKFGPDSGAETELMMYNYMKENNLL